MNVEEIAQANAAMSNMSAIEIIQWAYQRFGNRLRADTSFGMDSALIWDTVAESGANIGFTFGDTRLLAPQTYDQKNALTSRYNMSLDVASPSDEALTDIIERALWRSSRRTDLDEFLETVKLEPLRKLDQRLGKLATLAAARRDQTPDREGLDYVVQSRDGGIRIYPFLKWPQTQVDDYIDRKGLPRNKLPQLYGLDAISHRNIVYFNGQIEVVSFDSCGRNTPDGRPVYQPSKA